MTTRLQQALALITLSAAMAGASAAPAQLVTNGDFETGSLSGWSTSGLGTTGSCPAGNRDFNVSTSGGATGCLAVANPIGSYAAYVMNDGIGPVTYKLFQDITIGYGVSDAHLTFSLSSLNLSDRGRTFTALIDGVSVYSSTTYSGDSAWLAHDVDVTSILAAREGQTVRLEFQNYIPVMWSGAAGLGLDNVGLALDQSDDKPLPEPASLALAGVALIGLAAARRRKA